MKTIKQMVYCIAVFLMLSNSILAQTGTSCGNPISFPTAASCNMQTMSFAENQTSLWVEFMATESGVLIGTAESSSAPNAHLHTITVYRVGSYCQYMQVVKEIDLLAFSSLVSTGLDVYDLTVGDNYLIEFTRGVPTECGDQKCIVEEAFFDLCVFEITPQLALSPGICTNGLCCVGAFGGRQNTCVDWLTTCTDETINVAHAAPNNSFLTNGNWDFFWDVTGSSTAPSFFQYNNTSIGFQVSYPNSGTYYIILYRRYTQPPFTYVPDSWVEITVVDLPQPQFGFMENPMCSSSTEIIYTGTTSGNTTLEVSINGGTPGPFFQNNFGLGFPPGTYDVTVIATNECGSNSITQQFIVGTVVDFTVQDGCVGEPIQFTDNSSCSPSVWDWDFGDGNGSNLQNPTHIYNAAGTYNVTLTVNNDPLTALTQTITIFDQPTPPVVAGEFCSCCSGANTYFVDDIYATYDWEIIPTTAFTGDGTNSITVDWTALGGADATIELTVTNADGCANTVQYPVEGCCDIQNELLGGAPITFSTPPCVPTTLSSLGQPTVLTNPNPIIINGELIIDQNFTCNGCFIYMAPNAKITIEPGITFDLNDGSIQAGCGKMWDGIYISDMTASFGANSNAFFNAENAVVSVNGGSYKMEQCLFQNNYKGIVVESFAGNHLGVVDASIFRTSGTLLPPYSGMRGFEGMEVNDVDLLNINRDNTFDNLDYGIQGFRSNLVIQGNSFLNITNPNPNADPGVGTAIRLTGDQNTHYGLQVGGGNQQASNSFDNCYWGVRAQQNVDVDVRRNSFTNMELVSIAVAFNKSGGINIERNEIEHANGVIGINSFENSQSVILIKNNAINFPNAGGTQFIETGIAVSNVLPGLGNITKVENNLIRQPETGIFLQNMDGAEVFNNRVQFNFTNANLGTAMIQRNGIWLEMCPNSTVEANRVQRGGDVPDNNEFLTGIHVENSALTTVFKNETRRVGKGLEFKHANNNSTIECNSMLQNFHGLFLDFADVGHQGSSNAPTDNRWVNNIDIYNSDGDLGMDPVDWYHNSGTNFNPAPSPTLVLSNFNPILTNGPSPCAVTPGPNGPGPQLREQLFGPIVRNERSFNANNAEFTFYDQITAFRAFVDNPAWLNQGTQDDIDYQNFYSTCEQADVGAICQVQELVKVGDISNANLVTNSINGNHLHEINMKTVYNIHLNTYAVGIYEFSAQQQADLEFIACQEGLIGGQAVYSARALLGWFNSCATDQLREFVVEQEVSSSTAYSLYPNPNNGQMRLKYELGDGQSGELIILDLAGRQLSRYALASETQVLKLNEQELSNGLYLYKVMINDTEMQSGKFVIQK